MCHSSQTQTWMSQNVPLRRSEDVLSQEVERLKSLIHTIVSHKITCKASHFLKEWQKDSVRLPLPSRASDNSNRAAYRGSGLAGEQGFTALAKIKHEDFVVHSAVGKTNIIFFTSKRSPGTGCIKRLNDWMAEVLNLVTIAVGSWPGWGGKFDWGKSTCANTFRETHTHTSKLSGTWLLPRERSVLVKSLCWSGFCSLIITSEGTLPFKHNKIYPGGKRFWYLFSFWLFEFFSFFSSNILQIWHFRDRIKKTF